MNILIIRPYYGVNISGDMAGDFGVLDYIDHIFPDLSLINAATILKKKKYNVEFMDANARKIYPNEVVKNITDNYDKIIIKIVLATLKLDIEFARCLKKLFPMSKIVIIGRTTILFKKWINQNNNEIDEVSLICIEDYVNSLKMKTNKLLSLDDLPSPDYSLSPYDHYHNSAGELRVTLYTSRGCILNCSYCPYTALYDGRYEERSLDKLGEDIEGILSLGIKKIQFRDQYFACKKERTLAICKMFKDRKLKFNWVCETKIDKLDKETLDVMMDSGMEMICFGIETPSEKIHKKYQRPISDLKKLKDFIQYINNKGVKTLGFYIIGFPNENWHDMVDTYNLALELETTYANFNIWMPFIGTKSGNNYIQKDNINLDSFPLFKNLIDINFSNGIDSSKLEFVTTLFNFNYILQKKGLQSACEDYYLQHINKERILAYFQKSQAFFRTILSDFEQTGLFPIKHRKENS